jgi:peptidoglycan/LPS O-acetylase OafA/YrhL
MALGSSEKPSYIPTLDGWRAIAILAVLGYHSPVIRIGPISTTVVHNYGSQGVDLFFAISGLLICSRLLAEEERSGSISLRSFYVRRAFRILPPAIVFLLVAGLLGLLHVIPMPLGAWLSALFSFRNYYHGMPWLQSLSQPGQDSWYTGHFWSLAVEEHFYLVLPGLLVLFAKSRKLVLGFLIVFFTVWQAIFLDGWPQRTDLKIDALLIPAFLAVLLQSEKVTAWFRTWLYPIVAALLLAGVLALIAKTGDTLAMIKPILKVTYPLLILSTILHYKGWLGRFLELAPLRWIGRISYSIYLWQQLFFLDEREMHDTHANWPLGGLQHLPLNLVSVFALAALSYYLIEKPFVRIGHRLTHTRIPQQDAASVRQLA